MNRRRFLADTSATRVGALALAIHVPEPQADYIGGRFIATIALARTSNG